MDQISAGTLTVFLAIGGLVVARWMRAQGVQIQWSRRFPGITGGCSYLAAVLWLDVWPAVGIAVSLTGIIAFLRIALGHQLHGVTSDGGTQVWAEITYPAAGTISLVVGWALLGDRWLAFLPIAFMAWGDGAGGLLRDILIWRLWLPGRWPSAAMLGVCLALALFYQPYWIAAAAAFTAAGAEYYSPRIPWLRDDNLSLVGASLAVMAVLTTVAG